MRKICVSTLFVRLLLCLFVGTIVICQEMHHQTKIMEITQSPSLLSLIQRFTMADF